MGGDHFPAYIGESDQGLALATDEITPTNLELEIGGGKIVSERQYFKPDSLLLDAWSRLAIDKV